MYLRLDPKPEIQTQCNIFAGKLFEENQEKEKQPREVIVIQYIIAIRSAPDIIQSSKKIVCSTGASIYIKEQWHELTWSRRRRRGSIWRDMGLKSVLSLEGEMMCECGQEWKSVDFVLCDSWIWKFSWKTDSGFWWWKPNWWLNCYSSKHFLKIQYKCRLQSRIIK